VDDDGSVTISAEVAQFFRAFLNDMNLAIGLPDLRKRAEIFAKAKDELGME
jgi:hypothetical protein